MASPITRTRTRLSAGADCQQFVDDNQAMAMLLVTLETHNSDMLVVGELGDLVQSRRRIGSIKPTAIDGAAVLDAAAGERRTVLFRIPEGTKMDVLNAGCGEGIAERRLAETWPAANGIEADVDEHVDIPADQILNKFVDAAAFVAH